MNLSLGEILDLGVIISTLNHFGLDYEDLHHIPSLHYLFKLITVSPNMVKSKNSTSLSKMQTYGIEPLMQPYRHKSASRN